MSWLKILCLLHFYNMLTEERLLPSVYIFKSLHKLHVELTLHGLTARVFSLALAVVGKRGSVT